MRWIVARTASTCDCAPMTWGRERCRAAPWKHGRRAAEAWEAARLRGEARRLIAALRRLISEA
jgi:hypothetical protein